MKVWVFRAPPIGALWIPEFLWRSKRFHQIVGFFNLKLTRVVR